MPIYLNITLITYINLHLHAYTDACGAPHGRPVRRLPGRLCPGGGQVRTGLHGDTGMCMYTVYVLYTILYYILNCPILYYVCMIYK